jgi:tetratricopeptide (TPR) repeat protein
MTHAKTYTRAIVVFFAALFFTLATQGTVLAKDNWMSVRSKNFFLVGNASEKDIRQVANRLEQFRQIFALVFPKANFTSPVPTTVIVFKSDRSYKPFKPNPNVAGYFQPGEDVNYITLTSERYSDDNPFAVIFHEYTHLLIENTMGHTVPLWFNEGLAEFYSTFNVTDENRKVILGDLVRNHVLYLRENKLLPLQTLFAVDYRSPYYNEGNKMNIFYAESWMLVHFLIQGNEKRRVPQLGKFLDLISSNVAIRDAFQQAFQTSFEAFEKEFKAYIQGSKYMGTAVTFEKKLDFDSQMQSAPISEAEAQAYLGDLLLHTNRLNDAETRLQQSLSLTPDLPLAETSLGMVRVRQGKFDEAKQHLQKAVAANSQNYLAHYYYAFALSRVGMNEYQVVSSYPPNAAETMRAELRKAIELKPDFSESYSLLAFVNLVTGEDLDQSIDLLKHALSLSRSDQQVLFMLAQLYMRKQDFAGARQLLQPIASNSPDPRLRAHAQSMLDGLTRMEEQMARYKAMEREGGSSADAVPRLVRRTGNGAPEEAGQPADLDPAAMLGEALRKPHEGETRIQGMLVALECNARGITFQVRTVDRVLKLHTDNFERMDIKAFTPDVGGEISCGPRKPENPVVITYVPARDTRKVDGEAAALEFVPKNFTLKN